MFSQKQPLIAHDSLLKKEFTTLHSQFFDTQTPDSIASLYANAYLLKAKNLGDSKKIIDGYYYKSLLASDDLKLHYIDSLIQYATKRPDHYLLENALIIKAGDLYLKNLYKDALDVFLEAQKYAKAADNKKALFNIEYSIGVIYNLIGEYKKGLKTLKKSLKNFETLALKDEGRRLNIMSSMATSYRQLRMHDSVTYYTSKARLYNVLVLKEGINLYQTQEYAKAVDSIQKVIPYFQQQEDDSNLAYAYFYLGKTYLKTERPTKAIDYLKKVDTIFLNINYLFPETRAAYELLIDHYKQKKDLSKQLLYIERLLQVDSIIYDKGLYLMKHISEDYNTPRLIADKQQVIQSLEEDKQYYRLGIILAIVIAVITIGFLIYQYVQRNLYQKRFEQLLQAQEDKKQHTIIDVSDQKKAALNIPEDIVAAVLEKLSDFKQKEAFLTSNITLQKLAKDFKTNHTYLSKIINMYEGKSFNAFINDLRISYTINRLQNDSVFRKYTIDAIAEESGFSNTRTFSRAFQRKTNLNPSYFIKNLNASHEGS
jgi:AraC-like DNA-binding protein